MSLGNAGNQSAKSPVNERVEAISNEVEEMGNTLKVWEERLNFISMRGPETKSEVVNAQGRGGSPLVGQLDNILERLKIQVIAVKRLMREMEI
jgi:hypothetical protein